MCINFVTRRPSGEDNCLPLTVPPVNPKVHCRVHNSPPISAYCRTYKKLST